MKHPHLSLDIGFDMKSLARHKISIAAGIIDNHRFIIQTDKPSFPDFKFSSLHPSNCMIVRRNNSKKKHPSRVVITTCQDPLKVNLADS